MIKHCIFNLLINIKNNQNIKKSSIIVINNKFSINVLKILWTENLISGYTLLKKNHLKIFLKYTNLNSSVIKNIKFLSKPGKRFYLSNKNLWKVKNSFKTIILTTNKGILTLKTCKKYNIGGEPLFLIF